MTEFAALESRVTVADIMHRGVIALPPDATLRKVAELMANRRVHCVIVHDADAAGPPWGVVSDLDLIAGASVRSLDDQTAGSSATTPAITIETSAPLQVAAELMTRHAVTHLVVVDPGSGRPLAVVSSLDLAEALTDRSA